MDLVSTQIRPVLGMAKWKTGTKGIREPSSSSSSNRHTEAWRYKCSGYPGGDRTQSLPFGLPQHTGSHPQAQHKGQGFPFSLWVIPQTLHHKGKCLWKQGISKLLLSDSASMPSQMKVASKSNQEIACTWCISLSLPGRRCLSQALLGVGDAQSIHLPMEIKSSLLNSFPLHLNYLTEGGEMDYENLWLWTETSIWNNNDVFRKISLIPQNCQDRCRKKAVELLCKFRRVMKDQSSTRDRQEHTFNFRKTV